MEKMSVFLFICLLGPLLCQGFIFDFSKSVDSAWPGRCVSYTVKVTLNESSPIRIKFKMPFNESRAVVRILETKVESNTCGEITGSTTPVNTSREGNPVIVDMSVIDMGKVTVSTGSSCQITFSVKVQLLNHALVAAGKYFWVGMGVQYVNESVWAALVALKVAVPPGARPWLNVQMEPVQGWGNDVIIGSSVIYQVKVTHDCSRTSALIESIKLDIDSPAKLVYNSHSVAANSVALSKSSGTPAGRMRFQIGNFNYTDVALFNITFTYDSGKALADSKLHQVTNYIHLTYTVLACSSPGREYHQHDIPTPSWPFYSPASTCDTNTDTSNPTANAYTYATDGAPANAVQAGPDVWKPSPSFKKDRNQHLILTFANRAKIVRIATKGFADNITQCHVKSVRLYYSDDWVKWKTYRFGSKVRILKANKNSNKWTTIPLLPPIEAKYVSISPNDMENGICLKVKIFGCNSATSLTGGNSFPCRSIMFADNTVFVCNCAMTKKPTDSHCFFSKDGGVTWNAVDFRVKHIAAWELGKLYGNGYNGAYMSETGVGTWKAIFMSELTRVKGIATATKAKSADHLYDFDGSPAVPQNADQLALAGTTTKWGATAKGVLVSTDSGSTWSLKASWFCKDIAA